MTCQQVRDLLLTDYFDGNLDVNSKDQVDGHLAGCEACREFFAQVKEAALVPLESAGAVEPPEHLWERIRSEIDEEPVSRPWGFLEGLRDFFDLPRPAVVFSGVLVAVLVAAVVLRLPSVSEEANGNGALEAYSYLVSTNSDDPAEFNFGTDIEAVFL